MVLNEPLYAALVERFGYLKVYNEGVKRIEERVPGGHNQVIERGESYNVDCPFCGDEKQRLSISYRWLDRVSNFNRSRVLGLIHCYNESCEQSMPDEFWMELLEKVKAYEIDLPDDIPELERKVSARTQRGAIPMPQGCVPLTELPKDHDAIKFLLSNYRGFTSYKVVEYVTRVYGACWTATKDEIFLPAQYRIIFPIWDISGKQVAWQGRAISPNTQPRWYLPPGFVKVFYNLHGVSPLDIPVLSEGILNAIFSGPTGIAMFGKQLNTLRAEQLSERFKVAIIATDADTFVPDNRKGGGGRVYVEELQNLLGKHLEDVRTIRWPQEVLELARKHNDGEDVSVPDAADLGMREMNKLINKVMD